MSTVFLLLESQEVRWARRGCVCVCALSLYVGEWVVWVWVDRGGVEVTSGREAAEAATARLNGVDCEDNAEEEDDDDEDEDAKKDEDEDEDEDVCEDMDCCSCWGWRWGWNGA